MKKAGLWGVAAVVGIAALVSLSTCEPREPTARELAQETFDNNVDLGDGALGIVGGMIAAEIIDETFDGIENKRKYGTFRKPKTRTVKPRIGRTTRITPRISVRPF